MNTEIMEAKAGPLRALLNSETMRAQIARVLPKHCTAERFLRVATTTLLKTPKLALCSQESFVQAMMDCSSLGIEPDGRLAHLVPYKTTCTLIVDWKGLVALAKRSGEVRVWRPGTVKGEDVFWWKNGEVHHEIDWRRGRGDLQCVYSHVITKDGAHDFEVMTLEEVETIRKGSKAGNDGPWVTHFEEMAKKTVMRRHSKRLTLSAEFHDAVDMDDRLEDTIEVETVPLEQTPPAPAAAEKKKRESTAEAGRTQRGRRGKGKDAASAKAARLRADDGKHDLRTPAEIVPDDLDGALQQLAEEKGVAVEVLVIEAAGNEESNVKEKPLKDLTVDDKRNVIRAWVREE